METMMHHMASPRADRLRREADIERLARSGSGERHRAAFARLVNDIFSR